MKLTTKIILGLLVGLFISILINVIQYWVYHREPEIDIVVDTSIDTVIDSTVMVTHDTIYNIIYKDTTIYEPVPVEIDTAENIKIYRDTIYHNYGWTFLESAAMGSLLYQNVGFQFSIPNYYTTRTVTNTVTNTITNTITNTVRNNCLFATVGLNYNFDNHNFYPSAGLAYIWNKHKRYISMEYSLDKRIDLNIGFSLWR